MTKNTRNNGKDQTIVKIMNCIFALGNGYNVHL